MRNLVKQIRGSEADAEDSDADAYNNTQLSKKGNHRLYYCSPCC